VIAETPRKTLRIPIPASNHSKHDAQRNETEGSSETSGMQGDGAGRPANNHKANKQR